ncbi:mRNA splicing protein MSL5 KNAG_0G02350 [Huiozyma naganishii CBS 8797]|uniref:Branchpoint-bridging protein n=1 Tax=Huiozyma naganishii (strain ATCC MYA-139 / BCRC 22969 / CBS 8797 / KCTC 17520 / NBRC 10181 / NCYC 3082 / Yp74L-3) TaxID=1071383 RepID=J7RNU9_HUIN7|nr:hypothetical protein KNAG_0G02350 [Kazachstania naganishii CBS 8797]CCK71293.1 hypothetical protein KNAG_0G02350 [Kazachstania naganishii CBS 8797]
MSHEVQRGRYQRNVKPKYATDHMNRKVEKLPTKITGTLTLEQLTAYQAMFRANEIAEILRQKSISLPESKNRSPSPTPIYDADGKRVNTREQLYKDKLAIESYRLVEVALKMIPFYRPPEGYSKPTSFQDKYYIPVEQYPEVNFVGLLLGPRGNTLKQLQKQSNCKIAIRGRGSVKEGKGSGDLPDGAMNMEDPLHCLIIGDSEDKVFNGVKACQAVVIKAVTSPEGQNDLKRNQLRDLAELNGTLREDDRPCPICGLHGHKRYDCPERESYAQKIICHTCGQPGHVTRDCNMVRPQSSVIHNPNPNYHQPGIAANYTRQNYEPHGYQMRYQHNNSRFGPSRYDHKGSATNDLQYTDNRRSYQSRYKRTPAETYAISYGDTPTSAPNNGQMAREGVTGTAGSASHVPPFPDIPVASIQPNDTENSLPPPPLPPVGLSGPPGLDNTFSLDNNAALGYENSNLLPPGLTNEDNSDAHKSQSGNGSTPSLPPGLEGPPGL